MYRFIVQCTIISVGLICGCTMFTKPEPPPPLPPIEAPKPSIEKMKSDYFKAFPWSELGKASKDGNDKDTKLYTIKEKDTFESIALKRMGDSTLGPELAAYNQMSPGDAKAGEKIVIPNPIIGMSYHIDVKKKGRSRFGNPQPFDTELDKGDQYRLRFESNITGYCYVFRHGVRGTRMLFPSKVKTSRRNRRRRTRTVLVRQNPQVKAHETIIIPVGKTGFRYDPKKAGDEIYVFLSIERIAELDDLMESKKKINVAQLKDVMQRVKSGEIFTEAPYKLLRISDPSEILGFTLLLNG